MSRPELTIVIPAYNMARWLPFAVESCLWQSEPRVDVLIVNDGSTDSTQQLAESYARSDARVRVHSQQNLGLGRTRQVGQNLARGRYMMWLDADDFLDREAARAMLAVADRDRVEMVCGNAVVFSDKSFNTRPYFPHPAASRTSFANPRYWKSKVTWRWIFGTDFLNGSGIEHPPLKLGQDIVVMFDLLTRGERFSQCADFVYYFRQEHKGMDSSLETEIEHQLYHYVPVRRLLEGRGQVAPLVRYLSENCLRDLRNLMPRMAGEDARWRGRIEALCLEIFAEFRQEWLACGGCDQALGALALAFAAGDLKRAGELLDAWTHVPVVSRDKTSGWHALRRRIKGFFCPLSRSARSLHEELERRAQERLGPLWRGRNP